MGSAADGRDFTGQDGERLGAKTPPGQMLGGSQGGDRETAESLLRELRGEQYVTQAELGYIPNSAPPVACPQHGSGTRTHTKDEAD